MIYLTKQYKFCDAHRYWNNNWTEQKNKEVYKICKEGQKLKQKILMWQKCMMRFQFVS